MNLLFYLMCGFAFLGSLDIGYFHLYRFRLYKVRMSRWEHVTHLVRELLFMAVFFWVMFVKAQGPIALILPALLLFDLLNSVADVLLEPKSRLSLGGLPSGEYLVHMTSMFVSGAITALAWVECWRTVRWENQWSLGFLGVPLLALAVGVQLLIGTAILFLLEAVLFARGSKR